MENLIKRNLEEYIRKTFRVKSNGKKKERKKVFRFGKLYYGFIW